MDNNQEKKIKYSCVEIWEKIFLGCFLCPSI